MSHDNPLLSMIAEHKKGLPVGMYSICSANRAVITAAMRTAKQAGTSLLVEGTANQVNQYGGYTGMTPQQYVSYLGDIMRETGFPPSRLLLGGDHLGPTCWQHEDADSALERARVLIHDFVTAGCTKLHLDTSMSCADDPLPLPDEAAAERTADLASAAEEAHAERPSGASPPVYVIGTEVPIPGGAQEEITELVITSPENVDRFIEAAKDAFLSRGLKSAWERVVAAVVQPGVEFSDHDVIAYNRQKAFRLSRKIESYDNLVFEAHSTDYQARESLKQLVEDHFAILKVGPWLTFAYREAVFALGAIEEELLGARREIERSRIREVMEQVMLADPSYWKRHYHGDEAARRFARRYSLSDRIRYYWTKPEAQQALNVLIANLSREPIPLALLSQYLPSQCAAVQAGTLSNTPLDLIYHRINTVIEHYAYACGL